MSQLRTTPIMPTFQSLDLENLQPLANFILQQEHPNQINHRELPPVVVVGKRFNDDDNNDCTTTDHVVAVSSTTTPSSSTFNNSGNAVSSKRAVLTPQALLSRDPAVVATSVGVPLAVWNHIRNQVAEQMILLSNPEQGLSTSIGNNNNILNIHDSSSNGFDQNVQLQQLVVDNKENHCYGLESNLQTFPEDDYHTSHIPFHLNPKKSRHPCPNHHSSFVVGTMSALDWYRRETGNICTLSTNNRNNYHHDHLHHREQNQVNSTPSFHYYYHHISSGSSQLDHLLAFPREWHDTRCDYFSVLMSTMHNATRNPTTSGTAAAAASTAVEGIPFGYITQFTGPPGSGKTQIALQAAINHAAATTTTITSNPIMPFASGGRHVPQGGGGNVYYLHHGSNRSLLRRLQLLLLSYKSTFASSSVSSSSHHYHQRQSDTNHKHHLRQQQSEILNRIHFQNISNAYQLLAVLAEIEARLQSTATHLSSSLPSLIILDSVSASCGSDGLSASSKASILQVGKTFKRLARQYSAAILLTNGTVQLRASNSNSQSLMSRATTSAANTTAITGHITTLSGPWDGWKPAMENVWQHVPDFHVALSSSTTTEGRNSISRTSTNSMMKHNNHDNNHRKLIRAILLKHPARSISTVAMAAVHVVLESHKASQPYYADFVIAPNGLHDVSIGALDGSL